MTSSTDTIAKSEVAFKDFKMMDKRLTNMYVTQIYDAICSRRLATTASKGAVPAPVARDWSGS